MISVPVEAAIVLGGALAIVVLLVAVFLYMNRKWCFGTISNYCCDEPLIQIGQSQSTRNLCKCYKY